MCRKFAVSYRSILPTIHYDSYGGQSRMSRNMSPVTSINFKSKSVENRRNFQRFQNWKEKQKPSHHKIERRDPIPPQTQHNRIVVGTLVCNRYALLQSFAQNRFSSHETLDWFEICFSFQVCYLLLPGVFTGTHPSNESSNDVHDKTKNCAVFQALFDNLQCPGTQY